MELYLVLEGERGGLPVYACEFRDLRIQGRAVPERLVLSPVDAGLSDAEVHWRELRAVVGNPPWKRTRLARGEGQWSLAVMEFHGTPAAGVPRTAGTSRYAAAVSVTTGTRNMRFETDGWSPRPDWADPDHAPGFRVSRNLGTGLGERAMAFARLPVREDVTAEHARAKTALRPIDLVLAAYSEQAGLQWRDLPDEPLDGEAWSWLFETIIPHAMRRDTPHARAITPDGKPVPWMKRGSGETAVRRDDIVVLRDALVILRSDDGDGWLGNDDEAIHVSLGEIAMSPWHGIEGDVFSVIRCRDFSRLRALLREAGYGELLGSTTFSNQVRRACEDFERDHGLPVNGLPDPDMESALEEMVTRMRSPIPTPAPEEASAPDAAP